MTALIENYDAQLRVRSIVPDFDLYVERYRHLSAQTKEEFLRSGPSTMRLDCAYGVSAPECCDLFLPPGDPPATDATGRPLHVFFHGGYWRAFDKADYSFIAQPIVAAGAVAVIANYALMPAASMQELIAQCRRLIGWLHTHAGEFGASHERISLSGHSAGAHIAMVLHLSEWREFGLPEGVIRSTVAVSGLYDLYPVLRSFLKEETGLTRDDVRRFSPMAWLQRVDSLTRPISLAVGADEAPEIQRQARAFASAWRERGGLCELRVVLQRHHMNIVLDLGDAESEVGRLLRQHVLAVDDPVRTLA